MKTKLICALLLIGMAARAQAPMRKMFQLQHADAGAVAALLGIYGVPIMKDERMKILLVSAAPEVMQSIEETVHRLDVPPEAPKSVEITAYILTGSASGPSSLPPELQPAAAQLKALSADRSFRLLDIMVARARTQDIYGRGGNFSASGVVRTAGDTNAQTRFQANGTAVFTAGKGRQVRITGLEFWLNTPAGQNKEGRPVFETTGINTNVDIPEGQKVVVGKSSMAAPDQPLVLVLTAKVLD